MKRLFFAAAFFAAIAGALGTQASGNLALEDAYVRNPDVAHCDITNVDCDINATKPCLINFKQGYREGCQTILFKP